MTKRRNGQSVPCPDAIVQLVERFAEQLDSYKFATYNETQVRREFIDPLFTALGWDVDNRAGHAEAYKDVIHEDAIKIGGTTKAPDYCFRIGGVRKFFVEAKKPSIGVKDDPGPAYQLRRYAWTNKLPLSIVTDFEEFAVYDCRIKPNPTDKTSTARVQYLTYDQYADRWGDIASIFAKDAILTGSFDRYAESNKRKRGTAEVDAEFLKEIEQWREELARNIALRNPSLSVRDLNYAVTKTIDRIIFLRMCEDRGVETYAQLQTLPNGPNIYLRLVELFRRADERYNSGLFHFEHEKDRSEAPDQLTPNLAVDDKVLKDIIQRLYYPQCPYEFAVMPAEILGQAYEQFLGKVIRLTKGHRAVVEEKPEVRKAGGVYYTPKYIVDYIVEHTVGKLLEGKTPPDVGPMLDQRNPRRARKEAVESTRDGTRAANALRVLDPACGSGSFLLGAYQFLLDWHLKWYLANDPVSWARKNNPPIYQSPRHDPTAKGPTWQLTVAERKRILLNSIHGVDIDSQAVEVTKLSLLLKVLEGENQQSLDNQLRLFHERALPDLGDNIKCGNSLIGPDFYDGKQLDLLDEDECHRINVFDWHAEFPQVFPPRARQEAPDPPRPRQEAPDRTRPRQEAPDPRRARKEAGPAGGFDAVIGNPPYIRMETFATVKDYLRTHYDSHEERADLYAYFVERAVALLNNAGRFGMILSNKFIRAKYGKPLRRVFARQAVVEQVIDLAGAAVFRGATVRTVIIIATPGDSGSRPQTVYAPVPSSETLVEIAGSTGTLGDHVKSSGYLLAPTALSSEEWSISSAPQTELIEALRERSIPLCEHLGRTALFGLKTGYNRAFIIDRPTYETIVEGEPSARRLLRPILFGRDIRRYAINDGGRFVIYFHPDRHIDESPVLRRHLETFSAALHRRAGSQEWFELQQPATALLEYQSKPKIIYPIIANQCRFTLDRDGYLVNDKAFILPTDDLALLGVLNSRTANFYFGAVCAALEGQSDRYLEFRAQYVDRFPLPEIPDAARKGLESVVRRMLDLLKQLAATNPPTEKTAVQRQIDATDRQIDQLVYDLYGLTDDDIKVVEKAME